MKRFLILLHRELTSYFLTPVAYIYLIIFAVASIFRAFQNNFFTANVCSMHSFFQDLPWILLFFVPAIAMRLWAEERRSNSIEFLFTLPITSLQAALAKFFAAWIMLAIALLCTGTMPITLAALGSPDWGPVIGGYLGAFLLGGLILSMCAMASALTTVQVVAFILGFLVSGTFLLLGSPQILDIISGFSPTLADIAEQFSCWNRFESLERGVVEYRDILYFLFLTATFLVANILVIEERKAA
ncbi:MAG: ABC transporter permease [Lentisphaerae bacterium]|nr:MAG: ABC transporter permease [Lentisphaerota bacterium]